MEDIHELDAEKVTKYLEIDEVVDLSRLDEALNRAKKIAHSKSTALVKLYRAIEANPKMLIQRLEQQDYNRDGLLNIDGFEASFSVTQVNMGPDELKECFYLSCGPDLSLAYQSWVLQKFSNFKQHFTFNVTPRETSISRPEDGSLTQNDSVHFDASMNDRIGHSTSYNDPGAVNQNKYLSAKHKIGQYILTQDLNLGMMFAIMDTNSNSLISLPEFKQKMRSMHIALDEEEMASFFHKIDINGSGSIDFDEFVNEFAEINTEKIISKIKKIFIAAKTDPEYYFNKHCKTDRSNNKLSLSEFANLVRDLQPNLIKREVFLLQKHFDRGNKGQVTKTDFLQVLSSEYIE